MMLRQSVIRYVSSNKRLLVPSRSISVTPIHKALDDQEHSREMFDMHQKQYIDELLTKEGRRTFDTPVEDPIIVKKFFVSDFDNQQMVYPEVVPRMKLEELNGHAADVSEYLETNTSFDNKGFSDSMHEELKKMNVYGYNVPKEFGGLEYNRTELLFVTEPEGKYADIALPLINHRIACKIINEHGSDAQRSKYLPKLANGDFVATTAFREWNKDELTEVKTKAEYRPEEDGWYLKGSKAFVINAAKSNLMLVLAETKTTNRAGDLNSTQSIFVVDTSLKGVTVHPKDTTIGHNNVYQAKVSFNNVFIPSDCVVSIPGAGHHIVVESNLYQRLYFSLINLMQMKEISKYILNLLESTEQHKLVKDTETIFDTEANSLRLDLAKSVCTIYATESSLYMTAGLMDLYPNTNIQLETSIIQTYSQDELLSMALTLLNYMDGRLTVTEHPINAFIRNAIQLQSIGEPKDALKLYVGMNGILYSSEDVHEHIKQNRNPLRFPENALKRIFTRETLDKYDTNLSIKDAVSGDFDLPVSWLEASIERLRIGTNMLLEVHGRNLPKEHCEIQKLAAAATLNYISFTSLSRGNRSWLLQLPEAVHERIIVGCVCDKNGKAVKQLMQSIEDGQVATFDTYYHHVAKMLIKNRIYFPVHPLTRFF